MVEEVGSFRPDRLPELGVGDRVVAVHNLGGLLRPTVRRGTAGVVIECTEDGTLHVAFANGRTLKLHPDDVALPDPRDDPDPGNER